MLCTVYQGDIVYVLYGVKPDGEEVTLSVRDGAVAMAEFMGELQAR